MDGHYEKAIEYRQKAEELRSLLIDMKDQNTRDMLEQIAAGYDRLAAIQENLGKF